jgi:hypothetical protein
MTATYSTSELTNLMNEACTTEEFATITFVLLSEERAYDHYEFSYLHHYLKEKVSEFANQTCTSLERIIAQLAD